MVKPITFQRPPKIKGRRMDSTHIKFDPIDIAMVKRRAATASQTSGLKVSIGNILITAYYQQFPDDRKESDKLKKEAANAHKHNQRS